MAGSGSGCPSIPSPAPLTPKILLAKPGFVSGGVPSGKFGRSGEEEAASLRSRLPSLNLLSDSWEFHIDRFLPFLTENTDFTVVGVIGPPGAGKSTIMNELYGFDGSSPGMLLPFAIQSEDTRAMAKHCTTGIESRVSADRLILLDTQPVFSPSVLAEMMKLDGSSTIPVLGSESLSAELAHEIMAIQDFCQLGVLLLSICHIVLVVSEGVHDHSMCHLMSSVEMLKHGIPDPSLHISSQFTSTNIVLEKNKMLGSEEYLAASVYVHTKLQDQEINPSNVLKIRKALSQNKFYFSFTNAKGRVATKLPSKDNQSEMILDNLFFIPVKKDDSARSSYESYFSAIWKLRDQVLSMSCPTFSRTVSERDWLKNAGKIWELIKNSSVIAEYCRVLQNQGIFRR
ncbi:hypothetical protein SAY86_005749 [Trapa natans]|uniref:Protein SMG9 n=1 Tax=Trapa natans TaxID=22666 RepID=A0AAN7QTT4_TRANT|nr:hypothetical protein SAY86_005749 [Trapa natans]